MRRREEGRGLSLIVELAVEAMFEMIHRRRLFDKGVAEGPLCWAWEGDACRPGGGVEQCAC